MDDSESALSGIFIPSAKAGLSVIVGESNDPMAITDFEESIPVVSDPLALSRGFGDWSERHNGSYEFLETIFDPSVPIGQSFEFDRDSEEWNQSDRFQGSSCAASIPIGLSVEFGQQSGEHPKSGDLTPSELFQSGGCTGSGSLVLTGVFADSECFTVESHDPEGSYAIWMSLAALFALLLLVILVMMYARLYRKRWAGVTPESTESDFEILDDGQFALEVGGEGFSDAAIRRIFSDNSYEESLSRVLQE
jgi:hypothetical protein